MSEIIDSLTCAHPTHHLAILQDFCSFIHFWLLFVSLPIFLCNLTGSRRNIGLACIINALLLPQTVLLKCSNSDILFESHGSKLLAFYFNRNMLLFRKL